jgi:predicted DNA binding protein
MIGARFRIRLPPDTWVGEVSREFHDATFRLLSGVRTGDTAVELGEVMTDSPEAVARAIDAHGSIGDHERLVATDDRLLSRYETTDTGFYEFVERSSLPPEFPVVVKNGWYEFDLTGTRTEFDRFRSALDGTDRPYELLSIVSTDREVRLLTDRQRELLEAAVREGYFEVPRECTLSELAATLDVDGSSASETLRRGEARLVKWFLTGATRERV